MPKKKRRRFTIEEKVRILDARQPNTTVAEVLRRHQIDPTTFDRWEKQAKAGKRAALKGRPGRKGKAQEREIERLSAG